MNAISPPPRCPRPLTAASLGSLLLLAACASTPAPTAALQSARQAISTAEQNEAGHYAPEQLAEARSRLASAVTAVSESKMIIAKRLAEQSSAEAELASATTAELKAQAVNEEMKRSTATLVHEMQRNAGAQQ